MHQRRGCAEMICFQRFDMHLRQGIEQQPQMRRTTARQYQLLRVAPIREKPNRSPDASAICASASAAAVA